MLRYKNSREVWVGDEFKNILLSVVAIILSICLAFLLFIATNQNALAKVHRTISTFQKSEVLSKLKIY